MTRKPTIHIDDGEWVTITWSRQHEECCQCGARHTVSYRVAEDGALQFKAFSLSNKGRRK